MICLLEDDQKRIEQFRAAAAAVGPDLPMHIWRDANTMIADLADWLPRAVLISLDHDLKPIAGDQHDPGCGYDVAKMLETLTRCCPVIIHTSNVERGTWMEGALSLGGWKYARIAPFGDDWIEKEWAPLVRALLQRE